MDISIKILIIPGLNNKTINDRMITGPDSTMAWLLESINKKYKVNLLNQNNFITLLDGKVINIDKDINRSIENACEFLVLPVISGG